MKKKILFVLPNLSAGGAERVFSFLAQNLDKEKYTPSMLIAGKASDAEYLVENVDVTFLEKDRVLNASLKIFIFLLKHRPNAVLSSIGHLNTVMGLLSPFLPKTKFIIREASVPSAMTEAKKTTGNTKFSIMGKLRGQMSHISYRLIDKVICQSADMAKDFTNIYKIPTKKIVVINNPITNEVPLKEKETERIAKFITVGRLSKEKGQIRLIKILSKLEFDFEYTIIGKGPYEQRVFKEIKKNGLQDKVKHIPYTSEVSKYMAMNDLFLQGSYVEGFPNTVLESCYVGTPVIAFDVPGGTKEIIKHMENGYLVNTEDEYLYYLNNRTEFSPEMVRKSIEKKFKKEKIISQYEALF